MPETDMMVVKRPRGNEFVLTASARRSFRAEEVGFHLKKRYYHAVPNCGHFRATEMAKSLSKKSSGLGDYFKY